MNLHCDVPDIADTWKGGELVPSETEVFLEPSKRAALHSRFISNGSGFGRALRPRRVVPINPYGVSF
jgi:hypothetical protein